MHKPVRLSVIIPTFNRARILGRTLETLVGQDAQTEIIVVDNGSSDHTAAVCLEFAPRFSQFRYFLEPEPGLLTGRHFGANQATGEYLAFIDDDVLLNPGYTAALIALFTEHPTIKLATGPCLPVFEQYPPQWLDHFWDEVPGGSCCTWLSLLDLGAMPRDIHPNLVFGLNFCIRRSVLFELGGFHPDVVPSALQRFQGDGETGLTMKAVQQGYRARYDPALLLHHQVGSERFTADYFSRRAFYNGVCKSFTLLRTGSTPADTRQRWSLNRIQDVYRTMKAKKDDWVTSPEVLEIRYMTRRKFREGFEFHQKAFADDPQVTAWVLRKDYWDYQLPTTKNDR